MIKVLFEFLVLGSVTSEDLDGKEGQVVLTNDDFSTLRRDVLSGVLDLSGGDVDNVDNDYLRVSSEVLEELVEDLSLVLIVRGFIHRFIKNLRFIKFE